MMRTRLWRRGVARQLVIAGTVAATLGLAATAPASAQTQAQLGKAFTTTVAYVSEFYPLWFTYYQSQLGNPNRLVGPNRVSPLYQVVVAINVDTLYASGFLDLSAEPAVLTIPQTEVTYSILTLDPYGDIFASAIPPATAGIYALTGPNFTGPVPPGMTQVPLPLDHMVIIFRADKFSGGQNEIAAAKAFRAALKLQPLSAYQQNPDGGAAQILPEIAFAAPFKTAADAEIAADPISFLQQLQKAVAAPATPPLSPEQQKLSQTFDKLFGSGGSGISGVSKSSVPFAVGAQAAHALILESYLTHLGPTNWINFTNIGDWGNHVVERSAITEFIQYGNNHSAAAYYHAFRDGTGKLLDGGQRYVLRFPKKAIPQAKRFWSLTAYTPESIELIGNPADKYEVASYTPGLKVGADGSITIVMSRREPMGVPTANWLPIPESGPFNVMLRVYGPEGSVADGSYVPPAIQRL